MNKITGIKAISFDADGTLWDFEKVMQQSLSHVLKELGEIEPRVAAMLNIDKMIEIRNRVAEELKGRITNLEAIRLEAFRQTLTEIGRPDDTLASHLNEVYLKHRFEDIELFDDVLPTLNELQGKYTLGLLSNGNSYPERCGLECIFQFVVFSQDYGVEKPDPEFFQIALKEAGCSKEQLLNVGDSLNNDVIGATDAGIKCVWLNRKRINIPNDVQVKYEIHSLSELLKIL
ncbi:MAG: HAD family hydrolase [Dehalococcoidales bacterium]|nr:MAG: HAD family hydrolase [Dehalococcoidales bacterium]